MNVTALLERRIGILVKKVDTVGAKIGLVERVRKFALLFFIKFLQIDLTQAHFNF